MGAAPGNDPRPGLDAPVRAVWIDAQLPPSLGGWLRSEHGVVATHLEELGLLHVPDSEIFAAAAAEERIVVVTKDADFPRLLQQRGPPPVVLWVRTGNVTNRELRRIVLEAWPRALDLFAAGESLVEIRRNTGLAT